MTHDQADFLRATLILATPAFLMGTLAATLVFRRRGPGRGTLRPLGASVAGVVAATTLAIGLSWGLLLATRGTGALDPGLAGAAVLASLGGALALSAFTGLFAGFAVSRRLAG